MKKITAQEHQAFEGVKGRGTKSEFLKAAFELQVGEALFITKEEWGHKASPTARINGEVKRLHSSVKFENKTVPGQGWSILRVE